MAQLNLVVTPSFEAALERIMRRRGFANKSEAVRTVIEEAAGIVETPEEVRDARVAALERLSGVIKEPFDWKAEKAWIYQGMDEL